MPEAFAVADVVDIGLGIGEAVDVGIGAADVAAGADAIGAGLDFGAGAIDAGATLGLGEAVDLGAAGADLIGGAADLGAIADVGTLSAADIGSGLGGDFVAGGFGAPDAIGVGGDTSILGDIGGTGENVAGQTGLAAEVSSPTYGTQAGLGATDPTFSAQQFTPQAGATFDPNTGQMLVPQGTTIGPPTPNPTAINAPDAFETFAPEQFAQGGDTLQPLTSGDLQAQLSDTLAGQTFNYGGEAFPPPGEFSTVQPGALPEATAGAGAPPGTPAANAQFFGSGQVGPGPISGIEPPAASFDATATGPISSGAGQTGGIFTPSGSYAPFDPTAQLVNPVSAPGDSQLGAASFQQAALDESLSLGPTGEVAGAGDAVPVGSTITDVPYTPGGTLDINSGFRGVNPVSFGDLMSSPDFANLDTGTTFSDLGYGSADMITSPTGQVAAGGPTPETAMDISAPEPGLLGEGFASAPPSAQPFGGAASGLGAASLDPAVSGPQSVMNSLASALDPNMIPPTAPIQGQTGAGTFLDAGDALAPTASGASGAAPASKSLLSQPIAGIGTIGQIGQVASLLGTGLMALQGPGSLPSASGAAAQQANFTQQQGEQLLNNAINGILTPSQQAQIQQQYAQQVSALVQQFYAMGRNPATDSGFQLALQQIQQELLAQVQTFINADYNQGLQELGLSTRTDLSVGSQQIQLEQAYQTALANALGAASRLGASGGTTINVPAGSTVSS